MEVSLSCLILCLTYQTIESSSTGRWRASTHGPWRASTAGPWRASTTGPWRVSTTGPWRAPTTRHWGFPTTRHWWVSTTGPWRTEGRKTTRPYGAVTGLTTPPYRSGAQLINNPGNECEDTGRCDHAQMIFYEFSAGPEYGWADLNPCDDSYVNEECQEKCDSCEIPDPCLSSPCLNGGTCSSTRREFTCTCPEATSGPTCEITCKNSCMDCGTCEQYVQFHEQQWPRYRDTIILSEEPCENEYIREQCPLTCNTCRPGEDPPEIPQPSHTDGAVGCYTPDKRPLFTVG